MNKTGNKMLRSEASENLKSKAPIQDILTNFLKGNHSL
ncbi:Uncharacterized protein dnm_019560 [Desulfonema magnum]|uniref:Uncharacterized protein n=1 Tax=Desulfonema magnum TaxID=45655 RepID=A0A975BHP7_9BACT|nr:Uncharacterized protein dnm_019560 [Desulfonema magnum]